MMMGKHESTHQVTNVRRVYTDAQGNYYDAVVSTVNCACNHDRGHTAVTERVPYVPPRGRD